MRYEEEEDLESRFRDVQYDARKATEQTVEEVQLQVKSLTNTIDDMGCLLEEMFDEVMRWRAKYPGEKP
jgi:hypothetical protein